ncbi:MAG: hypothetical protein JWM05_2603 [Acidimicrobiales bacterium]|nr:hypothetical protein [Acidimicrobiales bacterium]
MPTFDAEPGPLHLTASFDDPADARETMLDLEAAGIDAEAVRLVDRPAAAPVATPEDGGDRVVAGSFAKRWAAGGAVSALVAAVLAVLVVLIVQPRQLALALALAALGGAFAGFQLGGFLSAASRLPVNEDAIETLDLTEGADRPVRVEVQLADPDLVDEAEAVMRRHRATRVDHRAA